MSHFPDTYTICYTGYSMYPALRPGDRLVVRRVPSERISIGDLLVLRNGGRRPYVHRLIRRLPRQRGITKGDALMHSDPAPVCFDRPVERIEAIIRGQKLIVNATPLMGWQNRLRALTSRCRLSLAALKQHLKTAAVFGPGRTGEYPKGRIVQMLSANHTQQPRQRHWPDLLRALEFEGMSGIAYRRFKDRRLPAAAVRTLAGSYYNNVAMHLACGSVMAQLETALRVEKIKVMTLKGVSLMYRYESHPGDRPMQDVDLWVAPGDRVRLEKVLKSLGFKQNRRRLELFKGPLLAIDLHTHPLHIERIKSRDSLMAAASDSIWEHCLPWDEEFCWVCRPADIDNTLLLSLHLLKHSYSRLIWMEDLRRLLANRNQAYMAALLKRSAELGCTRPLLYSLYLLQILYPDSLSSQVGAFDLKHSLSEAEKGLLLLSVADRPIPAAATALQLLAMREMKARFTFALESLFPGPQVVQSEFGVDSPTQHALFIPSRILKAFGLMVQPLRLMFRILYRLGK